MMPGNLSARIAYIPKTTNASLSRLSRLLVYKQGNSERKTNCATPSKYIMLLEIKYECFSSSKSVVSDSNARLGKIWDVQFTYVHIFDELIKTSTPKSKLQPVANAIINIIGDNKYREYLPLKKATLSC